MLDLLSRLFRKRPSPRPRPSRRPRSFRPQVEELESRLVPSTIDDVFTPMIVAGDETGSPADSVAARVDPNTTTSYFSGVGSVQVNTKKGTYIGTGTLLADSDPDNIYVLTAGHVVDINGDGKFASTSKDLVTSITFWLNFGGNQTHSFTVSGSAMYSAVSVNPNYTGFNRPSVNDDLAVIKFSGSPPTVGSETADTYSIYIYPLDGNVITMVGYGRSGYGDVGYTTNASWSIKRVGQNTVDAYYGQDDAGLPAASEVFRFDFDGPTSATNYDFDGSGPLTFGGTLGNNVETTLGGGDSGGPSFVWIGEQPAIYGVNTFTQGTTAPKFGSLGGGIVVGAYADWLQSKVPGLGIVFAGELSTAPPGMPGTGGQVSTIVSWDVAATGTAASRTILLWALAPGKAPSIVQQFTPIQSSLPAAAAPAVRVVTTGAIPVSPGAAGWEEEIHAMPMLPAITDEPERIPPPACPETDLPPGMQPLEQVSTQAQAGLVDPERDAYFAAEAQLDDDAPILIFEDVARNDETWTPMLAALAAAIQLGWLSSPVENRTRRPQD
jgi:hypothetical protein